MDQRIDTSRAAIIIRLIRFWLPVALMIGVMYYFSTDVFSADHTRSWIEEIFLRFVPHAGDEALARLNYIIRKSAHFTEYAILGALLFRAFRADNPLRWRFRWAVYSLISVVSWALLDEFHQSFTHTRVALIGDSLLDSTGGLFSLALIALYSIKHRASSPP